MRGTALLTSQPTMLANDTGYRTQRYLRAEIMTNLLALDQKA